MPWLKIAHTKYNTSYLNLGFHFMKPTLYNVHAPSRFSYVQSSGGFPYFVVPRDEPTNAQLFEDPLFWGQATKQNYSLRETTRLAIK